MCCIVCLSGVWARVFVVRDMLFFVSPDADHLLNNQRVFSYSKPASQNGWQPSGEVRVGIFIFLIALFIILNLLLGKSCELSWRPSATVTAWRPTPDWRGIVWWSQNPCLRWPWAFTRKKKKRISVSLCALPAAGWVAGAPTAAPGPLPTSQLQNPGIWTFLRQPDGRGLFSLQNKRKDCSVFYI